MITNTSKHVCLQYKNLFVKGELEFIHKKLRNKLHELWPHYYHKVMLTSYFVYYNELYVCICAGAMDYTVQHTLIIHPSFLHLNVSFFEFIEEL